VKEGDIIEDGPFAGFEVIHVYTRAQAIEDGTLVDLSAVAPDVCREHYKYPVACTSEVWGIIEKAVENEKHCNDLKGIIHDILWMSRKNIVQTIDESAVLFKVIITGVGPQKLLTFKIVCGPGDNGEPVLTIMGRDES
jgi:hypothetical protein